MKYSFYIFSVLLFFSCEEALNINELLSDEGGEQIPITTLLDSELNFTSSTISLNWEGNDYAISFSYKLESLSYLDPVTTYTEWSEWDSLTTVTFNNLDEGDYNFYIKSRFTSDLEETPATIPFTVNAITGPALRVYPLYQTVSPGSSFDVFIYVEEVKSIAGIEVHLSYESSLLEFSGLTKGDMLISAPIFFNQTNSDNGTIDITTIVDDFIVEDSLIYSGTGEIAKLTFTAPSTIGSTEIEILGTSVLRDSENTSIEILENVSGTIKVQ
jgi:hypothetical protein